MTTFPEIALWERTASEVMTPNPVSLREEAGLREAIVFLADRGFGAAPVIDASGRPVGVVSQTDILIHDREALSQAGGKGPALGPRVRDIMTPVVFQVPRHATVRRVLTEMVELNVHRLFVVDESGALVGVLTALDLLRLLHDT